MFRGSRRFRAVLGSFAFLGAVLVVNVAMAADRAVISGEPVVGNVLTASSGSIAHPKAIYQWQSCDPAVANCSDSLDHVDSNWTDLTFQSHALSSYTITSSDLGHFIRVVVHDNTTGDKWATSVPVGPVIAGAAPPQPVQPVQPVVPPAAIAPEHGISFLVEPAGGSVGIKEPGQKGFTPLKHLEKIPVKSIVDTRGGKVEVTAAVGELGNTAADNSVFFYDGLIKLKQAADPNAPATAKLVEKLRCPKGKAGGAKAGKSSGPVATSSRKRRRRVWGSGSGNYSTSGSGGTGSVRGTTWLTKDTCRGTFFKVTDGIGISVFDRDLGQTFELGPGQSYFARNR